MSDTVRVRVDESRCNGHGLCQMISPDVFEINPDTGFNEAGEFEAPSTVALSAHAGANACPEHAITIQER